MYAHEFFEDESNPLGDPWSVATRLNVALLDKLARGPVPGDDDLASALNLARLVHEQYIGYGTDSSETLTDPESRVALRTLRLVLERHGVAFSPPWRDFPSFRSHWIAEGCSGQGGWQARRDLLEKWFGPVIETLERAEEQQFRAELVEAISPRTATGWPKVDEEIAHLRQRFRTAGVRQDYKDVGNRCVGVLEALSATVYDPAKHCPEGMSEPPVDKTDVRIGAFIDARLPGSRNENLRGLVKKASAMAHSVKHSPAADRTSAGIVGDAVILLANMLRRLAD